MLNSFVDIFLFKINRAANENFPLQVLNFMAIENLKICLIFAWKWVIIVAWAVVRSFG